MQRDSVLSHCSKGFVVLQNDWTVSDALKQLRNNRVQSSILYFYVVDENQHLVGVLPARVLLTSALDIELSSLMIDKLVVLSDTATVEDASKLFLQHRLLAIPIVDANRRVVGVVDVNAFTDDVINLTERRYIDTVFESIGLRISEAQDAKPFRAFRLRFPWLLATISGGTACALLASVFGATLAESIVLAFFMTLVLGLGESVASQSMTLAVQILRTTKPTLAWFGTRAVTEATTATMLGLFCGAVVGSIVYLWHKDPVAALVIGGSVTVVVLCAALVGLLVPSLLYALKLDPRVAAGPVTLAMTDLATLAIYFSLAAVTL